MYAVVTSGGKQYRVEAGSELLMERLAADPGGSVTFDRVLLLGDGEAVTVGTPTVKGATVSGTVLGEALGPKLIIFKFKQKATYRRTRGHRQHLVRVRIDEIHANGKRAAKAEDPEAAVPETKAAAKAPAKKAAEPKAAAASKKAAPAKAGATKKAAPAKAAKPSRAKAAADGEAAKPPAKRRSPAKKAESKE